MPMRNLVRVNSSLVLFLQIGFIVISFIIFLISYQLMFPEIEKGILANPLQVVAQLSSLFFLFQFKENCKRHLCLLCLTFSLIGSLYLRGVRLEVIGFVFLFYLVLILFFPLDSTIFMVFCCYSFEEGLSKWGFFLVFQQLVLFLMTLFFKAERGCPKKKVLSSFFYVLTFLCLVGLLFYEDCYFLYYLMELAALLSGACIIWISLQRRTVWEFAINFIIYFSVSVIIGLFCSPPNGKNLYGIPYGIAIFGGIHLLFLIGLVVFWSRLPRKKQPIMPLFFGTLFLILGYFPELAWLERWIEGLDLLLLILGLFSLIEDENDYRGNSPDRTLRSLSNHLVEKEVIER